MNLQTVQEEAKLDIFCKTSATETVSGHMSPALLKLVTFVPSATAEMQTPHWLLFLIQPLFYLEIYLHLKCVLIYDGVENSIKNGKQQ